MKSLLHSQTAIVGTIALVFVVLFTLFCSTERALAGPHRSTTQWVACHDPVPFVTTNDSVYYEVACRRGAVLHLRSDTIP